MGTYATTTALATVMVGVTFDTATTALASKMIDRAEAEVNKYLSRRFDLTSAYFQTATSIPPLVRSLTEQIAEGMAWKSMSRGAEESLERGDALIKSALENLVLIQSFKSDLVNTAGSVIPDFGNTAMRVKSNTAGYVSTFAEDSELAWRVDPNKLDDLANERD